MADFNFEINDINRAGISVTANQEPDGTALTLTATDDYFFENNGRVLVHVTNGATAGSITFETVGTQDGLAVADRVATIAVDADLYFGPFQTNFYNDPVTRTVHVTFLTPATINVAVLRLPLG